MGIDRDEGSFNFRSLIERQKNAWENRNLELLLADFADDCLFIVPGKVIKGKVQLKQMVQEYWQACSETQIKIERVFFQENQGAIEWQWRDVDNKTGKEQLASDAIVIELVDGFIKYWREYIDIEENQ